MSMTELLEALRSADVKIWAESGELRVRAPRGALNESLREELRRQKPDLIALLSQPHNEAPSPIPRMSRGVELPLSAAQRRLWFLEKIRDEGPSAYNISTAFVAQGELDVPALEAAFSDLLLHHEVLRTGVSDDQGEPIGILASGPLVCSIADMSGSPDPDAGFRAEARRLAETPFELSSPPLVRAAIRRLGRQRYGCIVVLHHLVADGESLPVLMSDLAWLYADRRAHRPPSLVPLSIQYADFAAWQHSRADDAAKSYWQREFEHLPEPLELPVDFARPLVQAFAGEAVRFKIPGATVSGLHAIARTSGATLFMVLLSAIATLLERWTNQGDVTIGTPARGRPHPDLEGQVGCYVNTLALRCRPDSRQSFAENLGRVRETVTAAFAHESYPFDRLVDHLSLRRDTGRSPLFDVMLSLMAEPASSLNLDGVTITPIDIDTRVSQLDLTFNFAVSPSDKNGLDASIQYRSDLFSRVRIERLAAHLTMLLDGVSQDPAKPVGQIGTLPAAERQLVLRTFNDSLAQYDCRETLVGRFVAQARRTPNAVAVIDGSRRWSYAEIDARSNAVASSIIGHGVVLEDRVALLVRRGQHMMVGLLGILKAGGAYVPLQPGDPPARIAAIIDDCQPTLVLSEAQIAEWSSETSGPIDLQISPANLAYVLYTSGSTGTPKGVQIQHGSVINRITWMDREYGLGPGDVLLQKTPYTFDVSVWELFWWAFSGAAVAFLPPDAERDPEAIIEAVRTHSVTKIHFVPSMLGVFLAHVTDSAAESLASLCDVFASGEALSADLAARFYETLTASHGTRLHNLYGPTEATVDVTFFDCSRLDGAATVPIGAPVANTQLYVLNRGLDTAPLGVTGEIYIGGANVGRGYLNRPDLTAQSFVPDPWSTEPGARLYRTGDVGRWRDDGELEYLGRNDYQIKVRGHRIEPGEIEAVLRTHPDVRQAAVLLRDEQLVAYLDCLTNVTVATLREFLAGRLPQTMMPTRFAVVDVWPLTSSGKLDRRALLTHGAVTVGTGRDHLPPQSETEISLASVFAHVLGVDRVSADDDFFERGGHSLTATRVVAHARQEHGLDVNLRDLFTHPTVAALARCAEDREPVRGRPLRPVAAQANYPVSHAQRRLWMAEQRFPGSAAYNVAAAFTVTGALDLAALHEAWSGIQARHESLRTCFQVVDGEPRQEIAQDLDIHLDVAEAAHETFREEAIRIATEPFYLDRPPLIRMAVRRLAENKVGWIVVMHHIVCDGWSMPILVRELVARYEDAKLGRPSREPPLRVQYKDFAAWQRALVDDIAIEPHRAFWLDLFASPPPRVELPFDARPQTSAHALVDRVTLVIDTASTERLRGLGHQHGASLFMTLLALVKALLFRYTGQTDLTVGTVTAGRIHPDVESQIGFYVNTLAIRASLNAASSFDEFLEQIRDRTLEAFDHQAYPFDCLVDDLDIPADGRFPLFDVMVVLQNNETAELQLPGLSLEPVELPSSGNKFDLSFHFAESAEALELTLEFRADRFPIESVERMGAEFSRLVKAILDDSTQSLEALPLPANAVEMQTLAVVSSFTAEPIDEPLAFWMARLALPTRLAFAPFGQVFQELLDPSSTIGRNRNGANVCLLRLSDWDRTSPALVPTMDVGTAFAGHETHVLPNGATVAHLNAYETQDVYDEIFVDRVYARHGITIGDGDVVVDVGANIGLFSLFASTTADDITLFGFEPAPTTFEALRRNVAAYCPGAQIFNCGIGAEDGHAPFTFYPNSSVFSSYHADATADEVAIRAVVKNLVEREGGASQSAVAAATDVFMEDRLQAETVLVPIQTLSGVIRKHGIQQIDLLKLDAEKSERDILNGLNDEDWSKIRQVVIEVHDADGANVDFVKQLVIDHAFDVVVEEEERLHKSGLFTVYGRRLEAQGQVVETDDRNVAIFCDALRVAAGRAPSVPTVVISCPVPGSPRADVEAQLARGVAGVPGVTFVSSEEVLQSYPVAHPHDPRADELGRVPYTSEMYAALATIAARRIQAAGRPPYKVVVLDADETLWAGVVGEDGVDGIQVDQSRRALQEFMLAQRRAGMVLCLCSKNSEEDVRRAFAHHEDMPLRFDDFIATRINWRPKSENLRSLAEELGFGLDSVVFIDDNPIECAEVRAGCPEALTLCLPENVERIVEFLWGTWAFDRPPLTAEDSQRADFYAAASDRAQSLTQAPTLAAFIAGLDLEIDIAPMVTGDIPRVAQLTQRTNQFNTTTRRRAEAEVAALSGCQRTVHVVRVRDRFGDYGLVGTAIIGVTDNALVVDAMMLSCRAMGRGVEHAMLASVGREARARGLSHVDVRWSPTAKNRPARDFLESLPEHTSLTTGDTQTYRMPASAAATFAFAPGEEPADVEAGPTTSTVLQSVPGVTGVETNLYDAASIAEAVASWAEGRNRPEQNRRKGVIDPRTDSERELSIIWSGLLGVENIGINESFFDLGGHSLRAIRMLSQVGERLGVELSLGDLFADPTISGLLARADTQTVLPIEPIPVAPAAATYPLSGAQRRLWILSELGGEGSVAYNVPVAFILSGNLDVPALENAFGRLIARHESMRTQFVIIDGEPRQEVVPAPRFAFEPDDGGLITQDAFVDYAVGLAHEPITFTRAPLLRAAVRRLSSDRFGLTIVIHHVITDGWSIPVMVRELFRFYDDARRAIPSALQPLRIHYKDYVVWQEHRLASEAGAADRAFWLDRFQEPPVALDLPADGIRSPIQSFRGGHQVHHIDARLATALQGLASEHGATPFIALMAAFKVLLFRYTGQTDVTVGTPITGRHHPDLEEQVGFYVNTLALRTQLSPRESFASLLARVLADSAAAFRHQAYPFDRLVEELRIPRDLGRSPLFDVMLVVDQEDQVGLDLAEIEVLPVQLRHDISRFDLTFHVSETAAGLELGVQFNTELFRAERIGAMCRHFELLLSGAVADPGCALADLPLMSEPERRHVRANSLGQLSVGGDGGDTLVEVFRSQVRRRPNQRALLVGDDVLTYRELDERSDKTAAYLRTLGLRLEQPVGVMASRSTDTWIAMLGIMKAGGVYLPLDPGLPQSRIDFMTADSGTTVVLSEEPRGSLTLDGTAPTPGQLAYVIYTSGSTGQPKGVPVTHASLLNMARDQIGAFQLGPDDIVGQFSSVGFDASIYETFLCLLSGATLATVPDEARLDPQQFVRWAEHVRPTMLVLPPAFVRILDQVALPSLRLLATAGEAADEADARHYAGALRYVNAYGPTECAVCATWGEVRADHAGVVPIGRPVSNTTAYVLDAYGNPMPQGVPGALFLGGAGLARGYLNKQALTAERFVPDPFGDKPGARLYRTGDRARWRADGSLEFLGRDDFQVKVRGHRIELGEVEASIRRHEGISDAVVVARLHDLVAYVTGESVREDALKNHLRSLLPEYMVPAHIMPLDELPLTPSGKVDRRALPSPEAARVEGAEGVQPSTGVERDIANIWCTVLDSPHVGVLDNFFDLGGNSILLARVLSALRENVAPDVTLLDLFMHPRIKDLAAHLTAAPGEERETDVAAKISSRAAKQREAHRRSQRLRR
jgi:amino acid adenylation domain-containing protein/FkbH-like protein/FkbM family methyltransferase